MTETEATGNRGTTWGNHAWQTPSGHVALFDRMDGTFTHPAPFKTAEKCIEFWATIEIPDAIVDRLADAYHDAEVDIRMEAIMEEWRVRWFAANPQPAHRHLESWEEKYQTEREEYRLSSLSALADGPDQSRPLYLGEYDLPQLVRAAQIWRHAPAYSRFPEEESKALDHSIELYDCSMTVDEIETKYELSRFHGALSQTASYAAVDRIVEGLEAVLEPLVERLDQGLVAVQQEIIMFRTQAPSEFA